MASIRFVVLVITVLFCVTARAAPVPTSNPCIITTPFGVFDLSIANNDTGDYFFQDPPSPRGRNSYYAQPCRDTFINCSSLPTVACQIDTFNNHLVLGLLSQQSQQFANDLTNPLNLTYTGGEPTQHLLNRSVIYVFECDPTTNGLPVNPAIQLPPVNGSVLYVLRFRTKAVCLSGTTVSNDITEDTTWDASGSPYSIVNDITIYPGVVLEITGSTVYGSSNTILSFGSILTANTSIQDLSLTSPQSEVNFGDTIINNVVIHDTQEVSISFSEVSNSDWQLGYLTAQNSTFISTKLQGTSLSLGDSEINP